MKKFSFLLISFLISGWLNASVSNGALAPEFTLESVSGEKVSLSDYSGKTVVLEWVNPGCPFVRKFYDAGAMQKFQAEAKEADVIWLSINSTNPEHGDFLDSEASRKWASEQGVNSTWLLDSDGKVGQAYGARTTPHMFIINKEGKVVYQGAIDSIRDADPESIEKATNYVLDALKNISEGKPVAETQTRPYGCGVKYK